MERYWAILSSAFHSVLSPVLQTFRTKNPAWNGSSTFAEREGGGGGVVFLFCIVYRVTYCYFGVERVNYVWAIGEVFSSMLLGYVRTEVIKFGS